jgi:PD-(D/E)XK endonuclease
MLHSVEHPKDIGDHSTLAIMYGLRARGYEICMPFGENTRYDLVIDDGVRLARVQCKTGRLRLGAVVFKTSSSYGHHPNPKITSRAYTGEVEYFGVFCPETGGVYLVPIEDLPTRCQGSLRVEPCRNAQKRRIRHAAQYEIARLPSHDRQLSLYSIASGELA